MRNPSSGAIQAAVVGVALALALAFASASALASTRALQQDPRLGHDLGQLQDHGSGLEEPSGRQAVDVDTNVSMGCVK